MNDLASMIPEGTPGREAALQYETIEALVKGLSDTKATLSSTVRAPGENAPPSDWASFWNKLGAPQTADGYKVPEGLQSDLRGILEKIRPAAHTQGVTQKQWEALASAAGEVSASSQSQLQSQINELRSSWENQTREKFGAQADQKMAAGQRMLDRFLSENADAKALLEATGLSQHPAVMDLMVRASDAVGDDSAPAGGAQGAPMSNTPTQLRDRAFEILSSEEFRNPSNPANAKTVVEFALVQRHLKDLGFDTHLDPRLQDQLDPGQLRAIQELARNRTPG